MTEKPRVRIENWRTYPWFGQGEVLTGNVYGHPRFDDGEDVRTSLIVEKREGEIETHNTIYVLGEPWKPQVASGSYYEVSKEN